MYNTIGNRAQLVLIGLVGLPGSERASISNFLYYSYGFVKINVTTKIKEVATILGKTDLLSLRKIKYALRDGVDPDLWINLLERRILEEMASRLIEAYSVPGVTEAKTLVKVVVEDIETHNEFDFIKERHGLLIGLRTTEAKLYERLKQNVGDSLSPQELTAIFNHSSIQETSSLIEKCDFILDTDAVSPPQLEEKVGEIVMRYYKL